MNNDNTVAHRDHQRVIVPQPYQVEDLDLLTASTQTVPVSDLDLHSVKVNNDALAKVFDSHSFETVKGHLATGAVFLYRHDQLRRLLAEPIEGINTVYFPKPELQDRLPSDIQLTMQQLVDEAKIKVVVVRCKLDLVVTERQARYMFSANGLGEDFWYLSVAARNHDIYSDFTSDVSLSYGTGLLVPYDAPLKPKRSVKEAAAHTRQSIEDANRCLDWCICWENYLKLCDRYNLKPTTNPLPHVHNRVVGASLSS